MSNSPLINYTHISPNKNHPRNHAIDTITIHCMAGNLSVERCGQLFNNPKKKGSSNYGIGSDGRIALYVAEEDRSWCSDSPSNDHRAITIEVANNMIGEPWTISKEAYDSLIKLLVDICQRNNIKELLWHNDKKLIGRVDVQNMTVHRWFANKSCPGNYLMEQMGIIAQRVNKELGVVPHEYSLTEFRADCCRILGVSNTTQAFAKAVKISTLTNKNHALVTPLEKYMKLLGYYSGEVEALVGKKPCYGGGMKQAVICFQRDVVKPSNPKWIDGVLDKGGATWKKLLLG